MPIASLRVFSQEELLHLLCDCARHLGTAYQDTLDTELRDTLYEANLACQSLRCTLAMENKQFQIH